MIATGWLVDAAVLTGPPEPGRTELLTRLLRAGVLCSCPAVELELLAAAGDRDQAARRLADRRAGYRQLPLDGEVAGRALDLRLRLADDGRLRDLPPAGWLLVATAQLHEVGVLHADPRLAVLARACGVPQRYLPPGRE